MRGWVILFGLASVLWTAQCTSNASYSSAVGTATETAVEPPCPDGRYVAEVEYYNPRTGTRSTYTLWVEVEDGRLVTIYWPNGGWLDDDHFTPPEIVDGVAHFESDREVEYSVVIEDCAE